LGDLISRLVPLEQAAHAFRPMHDDSKVAIDLTEQSSRRSAATAFQQASA
jgi:hypothetical protein